jgi:hypothetical protein
MDEAGALIDEDPDSVGQLLGLEGRALTAWAKAVNEHYNDFDSFPRSVKKALLSQGIEDASDYNQFYDSAYEDVVQTYVDENSDAFVGEDGYMYGDVQRLVDTDMGDEYGEFGVTHPDQAGTYHHYDGAPEETIGHFRGTYNPADPLKLRTATGDTFEAEPGYVIEEIQSDAQKGSQQKAHLHQVHGVLFKAAIQKGLELGADTIYLPTAEVVAKVRGAEASSFSPIYDQAIVKEGLKPLLKIPGVTVKMVNGYREINFTPEAKEYILNGPGQTIPGYAKGGLVKTPSINLRKISGNPELVETAYKYGGYVV